MKFTIKKDVLADELGFVKGALESKVSIPSRGYVMVETVGKERVGLTGTDLDVTARGDAAAESIERDGAFCLPARRLLDVVKSLDGEEVEVALEENDRCRIKSGRSTFRLAGVNPEQFPELREPKGKALEMPAEVFRRFCEQVSYAISREESRYQIKGAFFRFSHEGARMVATDSHRLALLDRPDLGAGANGTKVETIIPSKALSLVLAGFGEYEGALRVTADDKQVRFDCGPRSITSRLMVGQFPNYEMIIPKSHRGEAEFDARAMERAVKRAAIVGDTGEQGVMRNYVRLKLSRGEVIVAGHSVEIGDSSEIVEADYEGDEFEVAFTSAYLVDALRAAGEGPVRMEWTNAESQFLLRPVSDANKVDIVMPRRL
jgi:DNA polymerase-3 subunit beta